MITKAVARFLPAESLATASSLCRVVVVCDPLSGVVGVFHGGWELVLWDEAVVHGDHDGA